MTDFDQGSANAAQVYDNIGEQYEAAYSKLVEQKRSMQWALLQLAPNSPVLDIGCGTGRPVAETFSRAGHRVTGIDVSREMIRLAASNVPEADFLLMDARAFTPPSASFDAICAYFSLFHMSRAHASELLQRTYDWLREGGFFLFSTVPGDWQEQKTLWLGQQVVETSMPTEAYLDCLRRAGYEICDYNLTQFRPEGTSAEFEEHLFVRARKPMADTSGG